MKDEKRLTMSKRDLARLQLAEFGKILFNLQIVVALIVASPAPFVFFQVYYAALLLISLFTGFVIFAVPGFAALWDPTQIYNFMSPILSAFRYTVPIVIGMSLLAILCLCLDKRNKHPKRIIASILVIVWALAYLIFMLSVASTGGVIQ